MLTLTAARPPVVMSYKLHSVIYEEQAPTGGVGVGRVSCLIGRERTEILRFSLDFAKLAF